MVRTRADAIEAPVADVPTLAEVVGPPCQSTSFPEAPARVCRYMQLMHDALPPSCAGGASSAAGAGGPVEMVRRAAVGGRGQRALIVALG